MSASRILASRLVDWFVTHLHRSTEPEEVGLGRAAFVLGALWGIVATLWVVFILIPVVF
jgi:hypothetical protein